MSYSDPNFKSKKALKEAVAAYLADPTTAPSVTIFNPGLGTAPSNGTAYLEGPHFPAPHAWYAQVVVKDGIVIKVAK